MSLIGLDLNATRVRAVAGPRSQALSILCLDGDRVELPLAISLEEKTPQVGRKGLALTRLRPHSACLDFLPHLGTTRLWSAGPHSIDAGAAFGLFVKTLTQSLGRASGMVAALPAYLGAWQVLQAQQLFQESRLRLTGVVDSPLAASLAACCAEPATSSEGSGLMLVVDVDGYALTWSIVERQSGRLHLRLCQPAAHLGRGQWLRRLLDGVAHRCVRQSRRDPRESALTEQALYEQITEIVQEPGGQRLVQLRIQGERWYHHLMLAAEDLIAFVAPLLRQAIVELEAVLGTVETLGGLTRAVITASAAGLPGLVSAVQSRLETMQRSRPIDEGADYGDLLMSALSRREAVVVLTPDAVAEAAHQLAVRIHRGEVQPGRLESIPLPAGPCGVEIDPGPARVCFRGKDRLLTTAPFTLGRDPSCDMVFESELYPHVSGRHCEIVFDRRFYTLCDRSRHGTMLNDRLIHQQAALHSGDWIRLGPHGPVLRFLGQPSGVRSQGSSEDRGQRSEVRGQKDKEP